MSQRVVYVAGREGGYSRTHNVLEALRQAGFEVETCFPPTKGMKHYPRVLWDFLRKKRDADLVVVGFYGQPLMPFVRLLTRRPVLFDVYVSTFGTMVDDRLAASADSLKAKLYWLSDHLSMRFADHIILESKDHILRYEKTYRVPRSKFTRLFLPSDERVMYARESRPPDERFLLHFHGEFAPFHGVDVILRAAKLLERTNVHFQIIGKGITYERDRKLADELGLTNVTFIDRVPYSELAVYMSRADACLGFFGDNARAERVFTNKVVEGLAVGKPLITRRNDAVAELLVDGESALLIEPGKPEALVAAIERLRSDPALAEKLGHNARRLFEANCTQAVFSAALGRVLKEMLPHAESG